MDVLALTAADRRLLAARFREHGNSHRRMAGALREAGAADPLERLRALRRLERRFEVDLGALCHRWERRRDPATHPIERQLLEYVACLGRSPEGAAAGTIAGAAAGETEAQLWILLDRLRSVREWIDEGRMVGEPEG